MPREYSPNQKLTKVPLEHRFVFACVCDNPQDTIIHNKLNGQWNVHVTWPLIGWIRSKLDSSQHTHRCVPKNCIQMSDGIRRTSGRLLHERCADSGSNTASGNTFCSDAAHTAQHRMLQTVCKENCHGVIWRIILAFAWRDWEKSQGNKPQSG